MNRIDNHPEEIIFHEYLDGALDVANRKIFEAHLAGCKGCAAQLARLQEVFAHISALPEIRGGMNLKARVMAALDEPVIPSPLFRWAVAAQVALATVALAVGWPILRDWGEATLLPQISATGSVLAEANAIELQQAWVELTGSMRLAIETAQVSLPSIPNFVMASSLLLPLVASGALLWLVGNGVLLRRLDTSSLHAEPRR